MHKYYRVCEDCGMENQTAYDRGVRITKDNCKYCKPDGKIKVKHHDIDYENNWTIKNLQRVGNGPLQERQSDKYDSIKEKVASHKARQIILLMAVVGLLMWLALWDDEGWIWLICLFSWLFPGFLGGLYVLMMLWDEMAEIEED